MNSAPLSHYWDKEFPTFESGTLLAATAAYELAPSACLLPALRFCNSKVEASNSGFGFLSSFRALVPLLPFPGVPLRSLHPRLSMVSAFGARPAAKLSFYSLAASIPSVACVAAVLDAECHGRQSRSGRPPPLTFEFRPARTL
jgi:hypothetical protein